MSKKMQEYIYTEYLILGERFSPESEKMRRNQIEHQATKHEGFTVVETKVLYVDGFDMTTAYTIAIGTKETQ